MDLNVADLAARGLDVAWDGPGGAERRVSLAPSQGVTGRYGITPEAHRLDAATEAELVVAGVTWPLVEGEVRVTGDAPLSRLAVDLVIPRGGRGGTKGEVGVGALGIPAVDLQLPALGPKPMRLAGLAMVEAAMAFDGEGGIALVAETGELDRLNLEVGGTEVALEGVAFEGLKVRRLDGTWIVHIATATAQWARVETGAMSLRLEELSLRRLSYRGGDVAVGNVGAAKVQLRHPELGRREADESQDEAGERASGARPRMDLSALDRLNGKLDVDVTADTTVPVIGGRRATHHFRLRVDHGAINYYRLEKSLSKLEDALLDFRVKDRRLVLLADVPFMPLSKKILVSWDLADAEELELAERRLVRLRRLVDYRLPRRGNDSDRSRADSGRDGKKSVEVRELRFDGIDVELRWSGGDRLELPSGGAVLLGAPNRPAIGELKVQGAVSYSPSQAPPGSLDVTAERLRIALEDLPVGTRRLDLGRLRSDALTARLSFVGLSPQSLELEVEALRLRDLELRRSSSSPDGPAD
jgi:hypothetical protein